MIKDNYYRNDLNKDNKHVLTISMNSTTLKLNCRDLMQVIRLRDLFITELKSELQTIVYDTIGKTILYYSIF